MCSLPVQQHCSECSHISCRNCTDLVNTNLVSTLTVAHNFSYIVDTHLVANNHHMLTRILIILALQLAILMVKPWRFKYYSIR